MYIDLKLVFGGIVIISIKLGNQKIKGKKNKSYSRIFSKKECKLATGIIFIKLGNQKVREKNMPLNDVLSKKECKLVMKIIMWNNTANFTVIKITFTTKTKATLRNFSMFVF